MVLTGAIAAGMIAVRLARAVGAAERVKAVERAMVAVDAELVLGNEGPAAATLYVATRVSKAVVAATIPATRHQ